MDIMSTIYSGVETAATIGTPEFLICCAASIVLGIVCAAVYMFRQNYSKSFLGPRSYINRERLTSKIYSYSRDNSNEGFVIYELVIGSTLWFGNNFLK